MSGALLAVLLTASAGIQLAGTAADRRVRLVATDAAQLPTLELMTKQQLENELLRLQNSQPRLLAPILFISVGAVAALGGLVLLNAGAALVFSTPALLATFLLSAGAVFLLGGVVLAIVGLVQIGRRLAERRVLGVQMEKIEERLQSLERLSHHDWVSVHTTRWGTF
jgi:hypothetical protein